MCTGIVSDKKKPLLYSLLIVAILLELAATLTVYFVLHSQETSSIKETMHSIVDDIMFQSNQTILLIRHNLNRDAAFFRINGIYVTEDDFIDEVHVASDPLRYSVESYFWVAKVPEAEKNTFNSFCNKSVMAGCYLKEVNSSGFYPVKSRSSYFPMVYSTPPLASGDLLTGFDFMSFPSTKLLTDTILKTYRTTGTIRVSLSARKDNPSSFGFILGKVSLKNNTDRDTNKINGIMMAIVNINDIFTHSIIDTHVGVAREDVDLTVFDITDDFFINNKKFNISLLYKENKPEYKDMWYPENYTDTEFMVARTFDALDRKWDLRFKFSDKFVNDNRTSTVLLTIISMSAVFLLFDIVIFALCKMYEASKTNEALEKDKRTTANKMLNYVNHEIRNPLNVINGMVELTIEAFNDKLSKIDESKVAFEKEEAKVLVSDLHTVTSSCEIMKHIVSDILDIRKLEEDKLSVENEVIELDKFIKNIHRTIIPRLREKPGIEFVIKFENDLNKQTILIDKNRLSQLLLNFLSNSIKFTTNGSITLRIYKTADDTIRFDTIDTGRGIPDDAKGRIFSPFQQSVKEDTSRYGGIGLGLYLCKMLATCMGGEIGFESEFGKGSTFWVQFKTVFTSLLEDVVITQ
jgi:signal transduction histidine kinase